MGYEEFKELLLTEVREQIEKQDIGVEAQLVQLPKNNGVLVDGIAFKGVSNMAPMLYVGDMYKAHQSGEEMGEMVSQVIEIVQTSALEPEFNMMEQMNWKFLADKVIIQVD